MKDYHGCACTQTHRHARTCAPMILGAMMIHTHTHARFDPKKAAYHLDVRVDVVIRETFQEGHKLFDIQAVGGRTPSDPPGAEPSVRTVTSQESIRTVNQNHQSEPSIRANNQNCQSKPTIRTDKSEQ